MASHHPFVPLFSASTHCSLLHQHMNLILELPTETVSLNIFDKPTTHRNAGTMLIGLRKVCQYPESVGEPVAKVSAIKCINSAVSDDSII